MEEKKLAELSKAETTAASDLKSAEGGLKQGKNAAQKGKKRVAKANKEYNKYKKKTQKQKKKEAAGRAEKKAAEKADETGNSDRHEGEDEQQRADQSLAGNFDDKAKEKGEKTYDPLVNFDDAAGREDDHGQGEKEPQQEDVLMPQWEKGEKEKLYDAPMSYPWRQ